MKKHVTFIILTGLVLLRFINLNQSKWLDELVTANKVRNLSYTELVSKYSVLDFHPPLHYFLAKFVGGQGNIRLISVVSSVVVAVVLYKMVGWWGAALWLANPLAMYYAQEGRMYMLVTSFIVLLFYSVKNNKWYGNIFSFFALTTFYGSIFFILALFFVYPKKWKYFLSGAILAIFLLTPLLAQQVANARLQLSEVKNWDLTLGKVEMKNLVLIPLKFFTGRVIFYPKEIYFFVGGVWSFLIFFLAFLKSEKRIIFGTLFFAIVVSFWAPMMSYFRYLYLVPFFVLGLVKYGHKLKLVILFGSLTWSLFYLLDTSQHREDWKSLVYSLDKFDRVVTLRNFSDPFEYYSKPQAVVDIREDFNNKSIYVLPYGMEIFGIDYKIEMEQKGYGFVSEKSFRGIPLQLWNKGGVGL